LSGLYLTYRSRTAFKPGISPHSLSVSPNSRTAYIRIVVRDLISWYTVINAGCSTSHSGHF
jgi:hypothetical protein